MELKITAQDGAYLWVVQRPDRKHPQLLHTTDGINHDVLATFANACAAERFAKFFETTAQVRTDVQPPGEV